MRKDKKQVIGDEISDDYIKSSCSSSRPMASPRRRCTSWSRLPRPAHRRFRAFVGFFVEAGYDLDGKDEHGKTFVEQIADQRNAPEYIEIIDNARLDWPVFAEGKPAPGGIPKYLNPSVGAGLPRDRPAQADELQAQKNAPRGVFRFNRFRRSAWPGASPGPAPRRCRR
jgi:hypothetical protein